jgi:hypothetical protein
MALAHRFMLRRLAAVTRFRSLGGTGFWNVMSGPQAAYHSGRTHLAWCDSSGQTWAAHWDHASLSLSTPVALGSPLTAVDGAIHVAPAVLVRPSDGRVLVANVANGGTTQPVLWTSSAPNDSSAFGSGAAFGSSGVYTYADLVALGTEVYFITGFWNGSRDMVWYRSTDGGATWGPKVVVMHPAVDSTFFWHLVGNGSRIDIYSTDTDRTVPSKVYHTYWDGSTLRNSAGTSMGALAAFSNDGSLVSDASLGGAYVESATTDGGQPAAVLFADTGSSTLQRRAVWNGSSWALSTVVDQGGYIGSNPNIAGGAIAAGDATTVFAPVKVGAHFEMFRHETADGGATWSHSALTSSSVSDNASPSTPQDAADSLRCVWGLGTYTSDAAFSFAIQGTT